MSNRWRPLRGEHVEARALASALRALVDRTELSLAQLAVMIPFSKSTISDKLNGQNRPQWAFVEAVVRVCAQRDSQTRLVLEAKFKKLWEQADPSHATLLPLIPPGHLPETSSASALDPAFFEQLQEIRATLNSIAAKQEATEKNQPKSPQFQELIPGTEDSKMVKKPRHPLRKKWILLLLASVTGATAAIVITVMANRHNFSAASPGVGLSPSVFPSVGAPETASASSSSSPQDAPDSPIGTYEVSGSLTCSSGNRVVGVWVQGKSKRAEGWAKMTSLPNGETRYSYVLPRGEIYSLHIGCGGTAQDWAVDPHTAEVSGNRNSFDCFDVQALPRYKFCQTSAGQ